MKNKKPYKRPEDPRSDRRAVKVRSYDGIKSSLYGNHPISREEWERRFRNSLCVYCGRPLTPEEAQSDGNAHALCPEHLKMSHAIGLSKRLSIRKEKREAEEERQRRYEDKVMVRQQRHRKLKTDSLSVLAREASEHNMTYGKYVAMREAGAR